jgi:hypothetical protein
MKNAIRFFFVFNLVGFTIVQSAWSQDSGFILAGASSSGDSLYSIIYHDCPDTVVKVRFMGGSNIEEHFFEFDLNGDGTSDFSFHLKDVASVGSGSVFCEIMPLDSNLVAVNETDTASYCSKRDIAIFNPGDTISGRILWHNMEGILEYLYWWPSGGGGCGVWLNQVDKFVGLGLKLNGDTVYGWARISVQVVDIYLTVAIKDFAVKVRNPMGIGLIGQPAVDIYPNPSTGEVRIITGISMNLVKIYRPEGVLIKVIEPRGTENKIDLSDQPPGVYLLLIDYSGGRIIRKVIIR